MLGKKELNLLSKDTLIDIIHVYLKSDGFYYTDKYDFANMLCKEIEKVQETQSKQKAKKEDKLFNDYTNYQKEYVEYLNELIKKYNVSVNENGEFLWNELLAPCQAEEIDKLAKLNTKANESLDKWQKEIKNY